MMQITDEPLNSPALEMNTERAALLQNDKLPAHKIDESRGEANQDHIKLLAKADIEPKENFKSSSDKRIENRNDIWTNWMKVIHKIDGYACFSNMMFNVLGAFSMLSSIPPSLKKNIEKFV